MQIFPSPRTRIPEMMPFLNWKKIYPKIIGQKRFSDKIRNHSAFKLIVIIIIIIIIIVLVIIIIIIISTVLGVLGTSVPTNGRL
jgi:hypothetical protein